MSSKTRTNSQSLQWFGAVVAVLTLPGVALAQTGVNPGPEDIPEPERIYSPYVERTATNASFAEGVYWGDTHLHTSYSTDSGMLGNTLGPDPAYRLARGEEVVATGGQRIRLVRPLDFLVISDHAENLGLASMIAESNADLLESEWGKEMYDLVQAGQGYAAFQKWGLEAMAQNTDRLNSPRMQRTVWDRQIEAAERFNDPGRFTALIGFEWTSINNQEQPSNLHRVVIFKDGGDRAGQVLPFSTFDSPDPENLWDYMAAYEERTGGSVLAIAHNGNLSNGLMFSTRRLNGQPIGQELRGDPRAVGAALRGHADQGRRRGASVPVDRRRVRRLWHLGQGRHRRLQAQRRIDAAVRVRKIGAPGRPAAGAGGRCQPVQVRDDRQHRRPHVARHDTRGELLGQDALFAALGGSLGGLRDQGAERRRCALDL